MPAQVQCPHSACGMLSQVPDELLNCLVLCPHCSGTFTAAPSSCNTPRVQTYQYTQASAARATVDATHPAPAKPAEGVELPAMVGRFKIMALLGSGAFGKVYRAYDPQLDREIALKVPQAGVLDSQVRIERFLREAKAAAQLRHPHIVPVHEAGCDGGVYYIASAYVAGHTLGEICDAGPMEPRRAAEIIRDLADALDYAHDQGIVHRDVKPANVMMDAKGRPHLMDFGLAARQDNGDRLTHDGAILGTPAYIAPEQATGNQGDPNPASDQYGLAVVLFELLCGQTPFSGPVPVLLFNAVNREPPPLRSLRPSLPLDLQTICLKGLSKAPAHRYLTCKEMADDLRRWLECEPVRARSLGLPERMLRWCRREPKVTVASLIALSCLAVTSIGAILGATYLGQLAHSESLARAEADVKREESENLKNEAETRRLHLEETNRRLNDYIERLKSQEEKTKQAKNDVEEEQSKLREAQVKIREESGKLSEFETNVLPSVYPYVVGLAHEKLSKKDIPEARELLSLCPERNRGWEWHYLSLWCTAGEPPIAIKPVPNASGGRLSNTDLSQDLAVLSGKNRSTTKNRPTIIDLRDGKQLCELSADTGLVVFGPDRKVACALGRSEIALYDLGSGKLVARRSKNSREGLSADAEGKKTLGEPMGLRFSPDGSFLACIATMDKTTRIVVFDLRLHSELDVWKEFKLDSKEDSIKFDATTLAFSNDNKLLVSCWMNNSGDLRSQQWTVATWNLEDKAQQKPAGRYVVSGPGGYHSTYYSMRYSPNGRYLALNFRSVIKIIDTFDENPTTRIKTGLRSEVEQFAWSADSKRIGILLPGGGEIAIYDVEMGREVLTLLCSRLGLKRGAIDIGFAADGSKLKAVGYGDSEESPDEIKIAEWRAGSPQPD